MPYVKIEIPRWSSLVRMKCIMLNKYVNCFIYFKVFVGIEAP